MVAPGSPAPEPTLAPVFRLVIICTGNRFRSPLAEAIIRSLGEGLPLEIASLGLYDLGPVPALDEALAIAREQGLDISGHRARPLKGETLEAADLILGFERIHVAAAVVDARAPRARTFTLPELVELLERVPAPAAEDSIDRARELVTAAHSLRDGLPPPALLPEIRDPWGGTPDVYAEVGERVTELCRVLVTRLFDPPAVREEPGTG